MLDAKPRPTLFRPAPRLLVTASLATKRKGTKHTWRLPVPGGWLYRYSEAGFDHCMVFVPGADCAAEGQGRRRDRQSYPRTVASLVRGHKTGGRRLAIAGSGHSVRPVVDKGLTGVRTTMAEPHPDARRAAAGLLRLRARGTNTQERHRVECPLPCILGIGTTIAILGNPVRTIRSRHIDFPTPTFPSIRGRNSDFSNHNKNSFPGSSEPDTSKSKYEAEPLRLSVIRLG
jgi:hypothetical protein